MQNWWTLMGHSQWIGMWTVSPTPCAEGQMRSASNQRVVQTFDHFPERNVSQLQVRTLLGILVSIVSAQRWVHLQNKTVICLRKGCKTERLPLHLSLLVCLITHCQTSTEATLTSGINWTQTFLIITKRFSSLSCIISLNACPHSAWSCPWAIWGADAVGVSISGPSVRQVCRSLRG